MSDMSFNSYNPATGEKVWEGPAADRQEIDHVVKSSREAFLKWSVLSFEERVKHLKNFEKALIQDQKLLIHAISEETGKPLFDSKSEVTAMINKIDISIAAYQDRCKTLTKKIGNVESNTRHKPHGVVAVFGPYNFPCHLPNGHIIPALLAGNTCIFKPSELTPHTAEITLKIWEKSNLPKGVLEIVQGGKETGKMLAEHSLINGLFFTGSFNTGKILLTQFATTPEKILALEMGGNNPLIVHEITDLQAASYLTIQSAFLTSGQRCTCARRLIVTEGKNGDAFIKTLMEWMERITVGAFNEEKEPFMGPVISMDVSNKLLAVQERLKKNGGKPLVSMKRLKEGLPFLSPGLMDVTGIEKREDEEVFGPFLQLILVPDFKAAMKEANQTAYGLSAGLLSDNKECYNQFYHEIKAGVISWNTSMTGASSNAPFGGIGHSGNYRPSAYYAADYCVYPIASLEAEKMIMPETPLPGISF